MEKQNLKLTDEEITRINSGDPQLVANAILGQNDVEEDYVDEVGVVPSLFHCPDHDGVDGYPTLYPTRSDDGSYTYKCFRHRFDRDPVTGTAMEVASHILGGEAPAERALGHEFGIFTQNRDGEMTRAQPENELTHDEDELGLDL